MDPFTLMLTMMTAAAVALLVIMEEEGLVEHHLVALQLHDHRHLSLLQGFF
jgi:hypothetical protein